MRLITIIVIIFSCIYSVFSQGVEYRFYTGATYYQGDLSPLPNALSFSKGHLAVGTSVGLSAGPYVSFQTRLLYGKISGDDAQASSIWRKRRNLSFESDLVEWGVTTELSFNSVFKRLNKFGINLYLVGGVNLFHFNPKATWQGKEYRLQPLGTEGQNYLPGKSRYSLTDVSITHGIGVKFDVASNIVMGVEVAPRRTFTDYIDDVSGTYVSYNELLENQGEIAANLANRTGEYLGSNPVNVSTGTIRGDSSDNDWYLFTGLFVGYKIGTPTLPKYGILTPATKGSKTFEADGSEIKQ